MSPVIVFQLNNIMENPQKRPVTKNATSLMYMAPRPGLEPGTNRITVLCADLEITCVN